MIGFIICMVVVLIFVAIGISCFKAKEPVGFFTGVKPPEIADENVKKYNNAVGKLWIGFAVGMGIVCSPLIFIEQNSPWAVFMILLLMVLVIALAVVYLMIESKYRVR